MVTFTNPRLQATFEDWPLGNRRGRCVFAVESKAGKGFRFTRTTTGKPKAHTYGGQAAIVDGSDGRTYLLQFAGLYDFIKVSRSDFMDADPKVVGDTVSSSAVFEQHERFIELKALIKQANPLP